MISGIEDKGKAFLYSKPTFVINVATWRTLSSVKETVSVRLPFRHIQNNSTGAPEILERESYPLV